MQWLSDFKASAKQKLAQFNNATFKNASMATCALIAAADGTVDAAEKTKVANLIAKNEMLQAFEATALRDQFLGYCEKADEFGRLDLLNVVRKLKSDPAGAETCVRVALIVANADGDFSEPERKVVRELCGVLGLSPDGFLA